MKVVLINSASSLEEFCLQAQKESCVGVDTEFSRITTYWPQIRLVQVATSDTIALIDPLSLENLDPLKTLFYDEKILKIFHAARQDLEIFFYLWGKIPGPIADTQLLACLCGYGESISYEKLVKSALGKTINKNVSYTEWDQRPLTEHQISYAAADVRHLETLYTQLSKRAGNKISWIQEEMDTLESPTTYKHLPENGWKRIKITFPNSNPQFWANLKGLAAWREELAQKTDTVRSRILKDDVLKDLARKDPLSVQDLERALSHDKKNMAASILEQIAQCGAITPPFSSKDLKNPCKIDLLKILLKQVADDHNIPSRLIASQQELENFVHNPKKHLVTTGWRGEIFGQEALAILHGKKAIGLKKDKIHMFNVLELEEVE